jgi:very-short-patch-repair endonuclease
MSEKRSTPKIMRRAGELRLSPTSAEAKLWSRLRAHHLGGVGFRRQHAIGNYITDFCAPSKMLIIELDGSQHLEQEEYGAERTAFLKSKGYRVLRFYNGDVMNNIEKVLEVILENLNPLPLLPAPPVTS